MSRSSFSRDGLGAAWSSRGTLIAFVLLVLVGGSNAVAVRFSNLELPPFWGAAIRLLVSTELRTEGSQRIGTFFIPLAYGNS